MDEIARHILDTAARMDSCEPADLDGNPITPDDFRKISDCKPARTAFVDGGNAQVDKSAAFVASLNRVCFTMYEGERRTEPKGGSVAEFFSLTEFSKAVDNTRAETRLFPQAGERHWLPDEGDLSLEVAGVDEHDRAASLPRKFAEQKAAASVAVNELDRGDVLVVDGLLQASIGNETKYSRELYDTAEDNGVILCGLAKTSRTMTGAGRLLIPPIHRVGLEKLGHTTWFVPVGTQKSWNDRGYSLVARLHEESDYVFRIEMLRNQYSKSVAERVVASLAANSRDASIPGYPYGAIEADNVARVRGGHAQAARESIQASLMASPEWPAYERNVQAVSMHERLNQVA